MTGIRELWPSLSSRERDAKVAEALSLKLWEANRLGTDEPLQTIARDAPGSSWRSVPYSTVRPPGEGGPRLLTYSTSWEHAGPLIDRLRAEGWRFTLYSNHYGAGFVSISKTGLPGAIDTGYLGSGPEAIALVFCLSREASHG